MGTRAYNLDSFLQRCLDQQMEVDSNDDWGMVYGIVLPTLNHGIWLFPIQDSWGYPQIIHVRLRFFIVNHPAIGSTPFQETPKWWIVDSGHGQWRYMDHVPINHKITPNSFSKMTRNLLRWGDNVPPQRGPGKKTGIDGWNNNLHGKNAFMRH